MLKKTYLLTLLLFAFTAGYVFYYLCYTLPKDLKKYEEALKKAPEKTLPAPSSQQALHVRKEIWHTQGHQRLHYLIESDTSTFWITSSSKKLHVQEVMTPVVCMIQERLNDNPSPTQELKILQAAQGIYDFTKRSFSTQDVQLSFYILPGSQLPDTLPIEPAHFQGSAHNACFTLTSQGPSFHAEKFKAYLSHLDPL